MEARRPRHPRAQPELLGERPGRSSTASNGSTSPMTTPACSSCRRARSMRSSSSPSTRSTAWGRIPNVDIHLDPSSREDHLLLNHAHKPLDDLRGPPGGLHGDRSPGDRRRPCCSAMASRPIPSFPAGRCSTTPTTRSVSYDPEAAKKLLADAGVKDLSLKLLIAAGNSNRRPDGSVLLKDQLGKVGIDVQIEKQEQGQEWNSTVAGDYDLCAQLLDQRHHRSRREGDLLGLWRSRTTAPTTPTTRTRR